jgi:tRNA U34 5-carboxymethylaminomethyl modifying GTPase MnmE/TrmE
LIKINIDSLQNLENEWIPMFQREVPNLPLGLVIGNKTDLEQTIDETEIKRVADKYLFDYLKVSAKTGDNLEKLLDILASYENELIKPNGISEKT